VARLIASWPWAAWRTVVPSDIKSDGSHIATWYRYLEGASPDYPVEIV